MNLAIITTDNNSRRKTKGLNGLKNMTKIKGEYLIERIIRIGRDSGVKKVLCVINSHEPELKNYLSTNNFGIPLNLIHQDGETSLLRLFSAPSLSNEQFIIVNINSVFTESEFSEFLVYSLLQEDADGVLAVTRYNDNEKPFCVAMNDEDIILKFSDVKDGYSWAIADIYYFTPKIFNELKYAIDAGISGPEKFLQLLIVRGYILKGFSFSQIIKVENASDISKAEDLIRLNE